MWFVRNKYQSQITNIEVSTCSCMKVHVRLCECVQVYLQFGVCMQQGQFRINGADVCTTCLTASQTPNEHRTIKYFYNFFLSQKHTHTLTEIHICATHS